MIRARAGGGSGERRGRGEGGPEAVGDVVRRVLRDLRVEERSREGPLAAAWLEAAGEDLRGATRPVSFRAGVLTVEVDGAALLQEVSGFRSGSLLRTLRGLPGGGRVTGLRFVPAGRTEGRA